uniref:Reverse transcriptase domain-containing protein n=1 Tax=Megaselia scalaris TaxID=36166 RepID=T1GS37_MEGSC
QILEKTQEHQVDTHHLTNIIFNKSNQKLGYADDNGLIGRQQQTFEQPSRVLKMKPSRIGLYVNGEKTKYILSSRNNANRNALGPNVNIEVVPNFICLGSKVTSDNNTSLFLNSHCPIIRDCHKKLVATLSLLRGEEENTYKRIQQTNRRCCNSNNYVHSVHLLIYGELYFNAVVSNLYLGNRDIMDDKTN